MAGRKRHSAEDIVRKLRRADELAAEGKTGEEIAAELGVSAATLYNWRRAYGGMDTDAAKELKELRDQNARLKRLLAELPPVWSAERAPAACWWARMLVESIDTNAARSGSSTIPPCARTAANIAA